MANKMLIDATHPEETRVVVVRGNRVEDFDFESATRRPLRGNIYLAKVTRVEPSLQAAFVEFGGNRHGFLAFSEIHPDYYQIPVADRQALLAEEDRAQRDADAEADRRAARRSAPQRQQSISSEPIGEDDRNGGSSEDSEDTDETHEVQPESCEPIEQIAEQEAAFGPLGSSADEPSPDDGIMPTDLRDNSAMAPDDQNGSESNGHSESGVSAVEEVGGEEEEEEVVESVGAGDAMEELPERTPRGRRQYKIQEVIKRRQIMLVQVVKEERGTKGAALTTYLSLAGRYSVLMPNTARGGGISRKITGAQDRKRLKEIAHELEVPDGMGVILRTAGAARTKTEIKRDFEYLLRLWETVRDYTLKSTAPTLVYEEGSLIKRTIRDLYNKEIDEVLVAGEAGLKEAKDFMRMLMPSHAKNVKPYRDSQPIFTRYAVESQLDAIFSPIVQLKSGGYLVINQTEALVAIDVNSGRATREHHIEDTALKTNLEAAGEIARQLRLRDLAGLIVIDFIDMDEKRNNRAVERRVKESLRDERARIQVGRISHFGLLEMSRQRIRTSVLESSSETCAHCGGAGHVRSSSSVALQLIRSIEEVLLKGGTHNLVVRTRSEVAIYVLNNKRAHLRALEERFEITITITVDPTLAGQQAFSIEKGEQAHTPEAAKAILARVETPAAPDAADEDEDLEEDDEDIESDSVVEVESIDDDKAEREEPEESNVRRRRRRRRGGRGKGEPVEASEQDSEVVEAVDADAATVEAADNADEDDDEAAGSTETNGDGREAREGEKRRRRRGRRGGRRKRKDEGEGAPEEAVMSDGSAALDTPEEAARGAERIAETATVSVPWPVEIQPARPTDPAPIQTETSEPPKRRSTVREPALLSSIADSVSPSRPAPVSRPEIEEAKTPAEPSEDDQPRRTGWWNRKMFSKG